ncbi:FAD-dependent monooxygenase [Actinomadura sp. 3N508]|uniref:FAD-dependent monooxygenase n=1 Tax=Actinomadura sp. 3N508 TaxID=3375153 RepID=UPI0037972D96
MADETVDVLVVGGSMVGLASALFLARQGVRTLLVEKATSISEHPRAQATSPRTMELMRALGLEDRVRAEENPHARYGDILQVESLSGTELGRFDGPFRQERAAVAATGWTLIGQDRFEPILLDSAVGLGAGIRFGTELVEFTQDDESVTAMVRSVSDGARRTVRASYMVAADGVRSPVRESLGIGTRGEGVFGRQMKVIFHADLSPYVAGRTFFLCFVNNPGVKGVLGQLGGASSDRWVLAPSLDSDDDHEAYDADACAELIRAAVGVPDLVVTIESKTSWEVGAWVADRFRTGRVLLAGDSAHVMPPTGGFGGNMGVQDAHNLAWKLALVLRGIADPGLLESYEQERRPVAELTVEQGVIRYLQRSGLSEEVAARHLPETTVLFGHVYRSTAIVGEETGSDGDLVEDPTVPSGRPGTRAPHLVLRRGGSDVPVHDLLDGGFWLLAGPEGTAWESAAEQLRTDTGLAIGFNRVGALEPAEEVKHFLEAYKIDEDGAALIRPDGFLAWRSLGTPASPRAALATAMAQVLGRS